MICRECVTHFLVTTRGGYRGVGVVKFATDTARSGHGRAAPTRPSPPPACVTQPPPA